MHLRVLRFRVDVARQRVERALGVAARCKSTVGIVAARSEEALELVLEAGRLLYDCVGVRPRGVDGAVKHHCAHARREHVRVERTEVGPV
jgi:hypothetical protein